MAFRGEPWRVVCVGALPCRSMDMFRLRNLVLLWLGRKLWAALRPAVQRRLRGRNSAR